MNAFYEHHKNSIRFQYRCFDRILLNGLIQPFQQEQRVVGFFGTYRDLYPVSRGVLREIATQFQNCVVSPDGQRFLMRVPTAETDTSPITLILNWKPPR